MEAHLERTGIGRTEFAIQVGTTDRTIRNFRKTGKIRCDILDAIAKKTGHHSGRTAPALAFRFFRIFSEAFPVTYVSSSY
jgi:hypothetical protein